MGEDKFNELYMAFQLSLSTQMLIVKRHGTQARAQ